MTEILFVKRLTDCAELPNYGSEYAAGLDLHADLCQHGYSLAPLSGEDRNKVGFHLLPGERRLIHTGIAVDIPPGHYGRIAPRSGLALKHGIDVLAGVVDEDYRGEVGVILVNHGSEPYWITHGARIAQLVIERISRVVVVETGELDATNRDAGGFGSTGD